MQDEDFMNHVLELAKTAPSEEIPVAAILVEDNIIIAEAVNSRQKDKSILGHAEINVMQIAAKKKKDWNLSNCTLYVNLEPCAMCAGAILQAHIPEVVFAAYDIKSGALGSRFNIYNKNLKIKGGILEAESLKILQSFFHQLRNSTNG